MNKKLAALALATLAGIAALALRIEQVTHAHKVSRITGTSYMRVLAPSERPWKEMLTSRIVDGQIDEEENCAGPCESMDI